MNNTFIDGLKNQTATVTKEEVLRAAETLKPADASYGELGAIGFDLQQLYTVVLRSYNEANDAKTRAEETALRSVFQRNGSFDDAEKALEDANAMLSKANAEREFFWTSIRAELNLWGNNSLFLDGDWKVYDKNPICSGCGRRHPSNPPSATDGIFGLFRGLSEGDESPLVVVSVEETEGERPRLFGNSISQLRRDLRTAFGPK